MRLERLKKDFNSDRRCVLEGLEESFKDTISEEELNERIKHYAFLRKERMEKFVQHVRSNRQELLNTLCPNV